MTIKELTETINNYDDIEVYYPLSTGRHYPNYFHTDNCKLVDNYNELSQVGFYELMGENEYNNTLLANSDISADFADWYGSSNAKVLCIMLSYFFKKGFIAVKTAEKRFYDVQNSYQQLKRWCR